MANGSLDVRVLSKHKIKIEDNVLSVNYAKKAYVSLDKITAVEFDNNILFTAIFLSILVILLGIFLNFVFNSVMPAAIGFGLAIVGILCCVYTTRVTIYASGYKLALQGTFGSMKELYEELKKLV
ncbi:hypothetical protein J2127_000991 [Methanococcus voltae]|uniref:hypothetical protein n=1 Tax=Methanococcus voltae TaxID=2188 RepID=UPI001AE7A020|nr:hypothetical protein [Methanococcus voltae]MBP2143823.1 hypothetical protein [Methanococcus voltae]